VIKSKKVAPSLTGRSDFARSRPMLVTRLPFFLSMQLEHAYAREELGRARARGRGVGEVREPRQLRSGLDVRLGELRAVGREV
jgi:hypothetical protein